MGSVLVGNKTHQTKRIWPVLEILTSKSTLGGSLILCNLFLGLKCAKCAFALCIRSTWESCKLWMAVRYLYFVPMDACQYLHSGVHRWFFIVIQWASWVFKSLPKVLLEYLPWCLAQDFLKMATGWWTILNFEAAVPDSDIGPGSIAMSHSTIGIWGFVIENYILGDGYQTFGAVRGHPKNWLGLLVEDLGRWSSVRRAVLQV